MGILKSIAEFFIGKPADIFDEQGRVRHKFTDEKWRQWNDRLKASPDYDWHKHIAVERAEKNNESSKTLPRR